jgi:HEAT repeat protein
MSPPPEAEWQMFRSRSLAALQSLARSENGAVAALLSALNEADAGFASEILFALGRIGPITPEVVPAIVSMMEHRPVPAAFDALAQIGAAAALAVPNLLAMLQPLAARPQPLEQPTAALAPQDAPPPGVFPFSEAGESRSWMLRQFQLKRRTQIGLPLQTLGKIGPAAREALPLLATIIQVQTNLWRYEAQMAYWQIDRNTSSALPGLIEGLADSDRETRLRLVQCFQEMTTEGLDGLIAALRNADSEVRKNAVQALGELGPAAEKAVPHLEPLLEDPKNIVRFAAENALKQIQPSQAAKWKAKLRIPVWSRATAP